MRQIILDTETTGLRTEDGHRIIEIGCIELVNRKLTGNRYHQYINPQRLMDEGAFAVHGISDEFLASKPIFSAIVEDFLSFINDAELIIHNASFDVGFINYELGLLRKKIKPIDQQCNIIDTLAIARQLHMGQRNSLDALCKRYGVDNSHRELHGALLDAHLLARVYLAMTGGQGSLFGDMQQQAEVSSSDAMPEQTISLVSRKNPLKIIKADSEEMLSHQSILEAIAKKRKVLWN